MFNNSKSLIHIVIELLNINNYIQDCSKLDDRWIQMVATAKAGSTTGSSCIRSSSWTHWSKPKIALVVSLAHQLKSTRGWWWMVPCRKNGSVSGYGIYGMGKISGKISTFQGGNSLTGASAEDVFFHFLSDVAASTASTAWWPKMDAASPRFRGAETAVFARHGGQQVQLDASWLGGQGESPSQIFWISISCTSCELCGILQWIDSLPNIIIKTLKHESPWVYQSVHHQHIIFDFHMETSLEIPTVPFPNSGCCCRPSWALL